MKRNLTDCEKNRLFAGFRMLYLHQMSEFLDNFELDEVLKPKIDKDCQYCHQYNPSKDECRKRKEE